MARWLIPTLLLHIPTCTLWLYAGLGMDGRRVALRRLLASGAAAGLLLAAYRAIPWPFGLHFVAITATQVVLFRRLGGGWGRSLFAILVTNILIALGEGLVAVPVLALLQIPLHRALASPWLTLLGGWLGNSLLVLYCLWLYRRARRQRTAAAP